MKAILKMQVANDQSSYLGLPNTMGRGKNATLGILKDKMQKRVESWDGEEPKRDSDLRRLESIANLDWEWDASHFLVEASESLE
uniref:Uncharacterized protein n=1 Tax=Cannabis sativa TaxID=3483 RepID=A0A803Q6T3_CANSA